MVLKRARWLGVSGIFSISYNIPISELVSRLVQASLTEIRNSEERGTLVIVFDKLLVRRTAGAIDIIFDSSSTHHATQHHVSSFPPACDIA